LIKKVHKTVLILSGKILEEIHKETRQKLEKFDLHDFYELLPRNLSPFFQIRGFNRSVEFMKEEFEVNRKRWNELVDINAKSTIYNLEGFLNGETSLKPIEIEELGDIHGKTMLHLQCHFGMDTLSWARKGVDVTGVDFSEAAIKKAIELNLELGLTATFIQSNIYDIPTKIKQLFDIVFTSYGIIDWLDNLDRWASCIYQCLKPGGFFYIIDSHPFGNMIEYKKTKKLQIEGQYFTNNKTFTEEDEASYAAPDVKLENKKVFYWVHTLSEIINSLINAGLAIEFFHEFPFSSYRSHEDMKQSEDRLWKFQTFKQSVPLIFSIKARKL